MTLSFNLFTENYLIDMFQESTVRQFSRKTLLKNMNLISEFRILHSPQPSYSIKLMSPTFGHIPFERPAGRQKA